MLPVTGSEPRLAYAAVAASRNDGVFRVFVDASSGAELQRYSEIHTQAAVGSGVGVNGDTKKLSVRQQGASSWPAMRYGPPASLPTTCAATSSGSIPCWTDWCPSCPPLDIAAHELTHAVTSSSSNLTYQNESGALNESFSDVMGASVEFFFQTPGAGRGQADDILGEDAFRAFQPGSVNGTRSLDNPRAFGYPDHYLLRYTGSEDGGGVHINSSIPNHAFYLAIEGGTNRTSGLSVQGVGAANREQIEKVRRHAGVDCRWRELRRALVRLIAAAALLLLAAPSPTLAQATRQSAPSVRPQSRFYAGVDFGVQPGGETVTDTITSPLNEETARFSTPYEAKTGAWLGVFVDVHVWQYLSAGLSFTGYASQADPQVTGSISHPFFFNRARESNGDVSGVQRSESGVHLQLRALLPVSRTVQVSVFGGPSFYQVEQDVVTAVRWTESYPFDTVSFTSAATETRSESGTGFNVGADVAYFLGRHFGVGGRVQYSTATVGLPSGSGTDSIDTKAGGLQAGGGVRFRF